MKISTHPMNPKAFSLLVLSTTLLGALAFGGCGKSPSGPAPTESSGSSQKSGTSSAIKRVEVTANDQMQYNITEIRVKPRQRVQLIFKNIGTMPKQSMGHDWVLLKAGTDKLAFIDASLASTSTDYIAPEMKDKVLAHTKILGPGETVTLNFTAPAKPDSYPYVCTFPGHFAAGMTGTLIVQ